MSNLVPQLRSHLEAFVRSVTSTCTNEAGEVSMHTDHVTDFRQVWETVWEPSCEPEIEVSTLATEDYTDPAENNCLDYACTLLEDLANSGLVDIADYQVVLLAPADPSDPGHVGLLGPDGRVYDQSGVHETYDEFLEQYPGMKELSNERGQFPAGDEFLAVMRTEAGSEREAALRSAGLGHLADQPLALGPLVVAAFIVAGLVLAGCTDPEPPPGPVRYTTQAQLDTALADGVDLTGAIFDFPVNANLNDRSLAGAVFNQGFTGSAINADLTGATFHGEVRALFHGAQLVDARFTGAVSHLHEAGAPSDPSNVHHSAFLYADLDGAVFSGTIDSVDFAFAVNLDRATLPPGVTNSVFTGTPLATESTLPPLQLNDPAYVAALGGPERVRALAATGQLLPALEAVLPAGSLDHLLGPSWRSGIYDEYRLAHDEFANEAKSRIFDAVDGRYGPYDRPEGGPTLSWMYDVEPRFRPYIDNHLANLLLSDAPAYLDDPFQGSASPYNFQFAVANLRAASSVDAFVADPGAVNWNGQDYSSLDVVMPPETIAQLSARFGDPAFEAIAADGIVTLRDLYAAGLEDHIEHLR